MKPRVTLVWRLTAGITAILTVLIALTAYLSSLIEAHCAPAIARTLVLLMVVGSVLLGITVCRWMVSRLLERPIRELIEGTGRVAAHQLDFRFACNRDDEIGVLQESFNAMTARIQASQEELRGAKEYLEGIVEHAADIIITVNPEGLIETFNQGAERALGYSREEVIGEQIETLFADPHERDVAIAQLKDTDHVKNYATHFIGKDGQVRDVLLTLSRLRDREGSAIGTFGISKDVTQERKLQRELVESQKFAAIGQAVTGIQHAIKNMLNALTGGAYLIRNAIDKDNPQQVQEGCAMVEEGIERITNLSRNMLNFAREWKPDRQMVDLGDLLANICELNRQTAESHEVILRYQLPATLPPVPCDPKLMHMAITDVVVNAIDACRWKDYPDGQAPEIVLGCSQEENGEGFVIEVRDNGCGMTEEVRQHIFAPFFSTKEALGTGLGLAVTARIISAHEGKIAVESEPDRGTTFRIHLPRNDRKT